MKKNFFKKLSFVLALAMIVSVLAPASGVFAATKVKLNSTEEYLHLGRDNDKSFNFDIAAGKGTGRTYAWSSSNEKVATVNTKNGVVTAKAAGSTVITLTVKDADGKVYGTAKANVTVRDNIKSLEIYLQGENVPALDQLVIGKEYDFGRKYVTEAGLTSGSKAVTRWEVNSADASIVADSGVFKTDKAGEYEVTARSFQSKSKYTAWLADKDANADYVTAEKTEKVTVKLPLDVTKQLTGSKFEVVFADVMKDVVTKDNLMVANKDGVKLPIVKDVTFDTTGKVATVETYISLTDKELYTVSYGDLKDSFVASLGAVDKIVITGPFLVADNEPTALVVKFYDANGVELATPADAATQLSFKITNNVGWIYGTNKIVLFNIGDVASVKAEYKTGKYDASWNEIVLPSNEVAITAVDSVAATLDSLLAWTIVDTRPSVEDDYKTVKHSLPLGTTGFIGVQAKDSEGEKFYDAGFTFTSTDPNKLLVNKDTGLLVPVTTGTVGVIVENGNFKTVIEVVVTPAAEVKAAIPVDNKTSDVVTNDHDILDTAVFKVKVVDTYDNELTTTGASVDSLVRPTGVLESTAKGYVVPANGKPATFTFNADGAVKGVYTYRLNVSGKSIVVSVEVKEPEGTEVTYRVDVANVDLKLTKDNLDATDDFVVIKVLGYDKNGVAMSKASGNINVKGPKVNGVEYDEDFTVVAGEVKIPVYSVAAGVVTKALATGNYSITGTVNTGTPQEKPIVPNYFVISDTQNTVAPVVKQSNSVLSVATGSTGNALYTALATLFTAETKNEATAAVASVLGTNVKVNASVTGGTILTAGVYDVLVEKVTVTETYPAGTLATDVTVNKVIKVTVTP